MKLQHLAAALLLLGAACGRAPSPAGVPNETAGPPPQAARPGQATAKPGSKTALADLEERQGPFTLAGRRFTVVLHLKRLTGESGPDSRALALLDIRDDTGAVQFEDSYPYAVEQGAFSEACGAGVQLLRGSNGSGLLIESGCSPSAPLTGGPWRILGVVGGRLVPFGKPLVAQGELGGFVPGAVNRAGGVTRILPDTLRFRIWAGYFFVSVPVRVNWRDGRLAPGERCMAQTGRGFAEDGCELPAEQASVRPRDQALTFVRLFREPNERGAPPAHVVVKPDARIEVLAGKVLIGWSEGTDAIELSAGEDVWVRVRIDGQEGWIHTPEDLNAIGLFQSG